MDVTFTAEILEAEDGSGDGILQFPEDFITKHDWREGDRIHMEVVNDTLVIKNLDWIEREDISLKAKESLDKPVHDS